MTSLSRLFTGFLLCGLLCSFTFAQSTGTLSFATQYTTLQQQFSNLTQDLDVPTATGNYADMISLLSCMQIPVPTNDTTYKDLLKKLKSDFDRDFATVSSTGSSADIIRLDFYAQSLNSLKTSLTKDRQDRQLLIQGLVAKNQTLFNQLSSDKILLDSLFLAYTDWSQKIIQYRALYGYTINQYDAIIANYTTILNNNTDIQLSQIMNEFVKKNRNLLSIPAFAQQQKKIYLDQFALDREKFFTEQVGGLINIDLLQQYQIEINSIKSTYYSGSTLQCGLLTALNQERRSHYQSLIADLKLQQQRLQNTVGSFSGGTSGSMTTGFIATGSNGQGLFTSGSQSFIALNTRYAQMSKKYQALYTNSLKDQLSLLTKVVRSEQNMLNKLSELLAQYRMASGSTKTDLKVELVGQISRFEKEGIVSMRVQKSLQKIKKTLKIGVSKSTSRTIKTTLKK